LKKIITGWFGCNRFFEDLKKEKIKFNDFEPPPPKKNKKNQRLNKINKIKPL